MKKIIFFISIFIATSLIAAPQATIDFTGAMTGESNRKAEFDILAANVQSRGDGMDYEQLKIKSYRYWDVYLHENQCYIGRVFVLLKQEEGVEDFLAIKGEVRDEFFLIGEEIKTALQALFKPDKMNYAALSNTSEKIHVHLVPRYKETREFNGVIFHDLRWGKNYAAYDRSFVLDEAMLFKIRDALKEKLR